MLEVNNKGWISLHRSIQDHWLWEEKPFDKAKAWIDLLLLANHKDNKFLFGNELVKIKKGSFITSELKLMERWGWSKTKVRNFLELLQKDNMILKKADNKKTTLTILNYNVYQEREDHKRTTKELQQDHKKTAAKLQEDTNNNVNNVNNVNNNKDTGKPLIQQQQQQQDFNEIMNTYTTNEKLKSSIIEFIKMRKTIKKNMTYNALSLLFIKLNKIGENDDEKIEILNQSIMSCWQGIFELKEDKNGVTKSNNESGSAYDYDFSKYTG